MANITDLESELDKGVVEADTFADLIDKYADVAGKFVGGIPTVGAEAETLIALLDKGTKVLDTLRAAVGSG